MDTTFLYKVATELMYQSDRILKISLSGSSIIFYLGISFSKFDSPINTCVSVRSFMEESVLVFGGSHLRIHIDFCLPLW